MVYTVQIYKEGIAVAKLAVQNSNPLDAILNAIGHATQSFGPGGITAEVVG